MAHKTAPKHVDIHRDGFGKNRFLPKIDLSFSTRASLLEITVRLREIPVFPAGLSLPGKSP